MVIKKPILVAGVSLSFLLWLGERFTDSLGEIGNTIFLVVFFLGGISMWLNKNRKQTTVNNYSLQTATILGPIRTIHVH